MAGSALEHPARGIEAKDNLDAIVGGKHPLSEVYNTKCDGPDGGKADMIPEMVLDYRAFARRQLKEEFLSIAAEVQTLRLEALNAVAGQ